MAVPRSIAGFEKALADLATELENLKAQIDEAPPEEEDTLYSKKADLEAEYGVLLGKFEEFKAKPEGETNPEGETKPEDGPAKAKLVKKNKVITAAAVDPRLGKPAMFTVTRGGYMVNPNTGDKFTQGPYKIAVADPYLLAQVKSKIMAIKAVATEE